MGEPNEMEALRKEISDLGERTDNQIAQLMIMMQDLHHRIPPPQQPPQQQEMPLHQQQPQGDPGHQQDRENPLPNLQQPLEPQPNPLVTELITKMAQLEASFHKHEKITTTGIDMDKLCLFPDAKLPKKFKPIDFEKFDGTGDPKIHLQAYVGSLSIQGVGKEAMGQMFHQSLTGPALQWFMMLDDSKKKSWEDIGAAFISQFNYNTQLKMTTRELESTCMGAKESFVDFVKRWRAKAVQMTERPSEKDQIRMIIRNLQPALAKHLVASQATVNFECFFEAGLAVEEAIRDGILENGDSDPKIEKVYSWDSNTLYANTSSNFIINNTSKVKPTKTITQIN